MNEPTLDLFLSGPGASGSRPMPMVNLRHQWVEPCGITATISVAPVVLSDAVEKTLRSGEFF
jgi:hypothetical protein